jgi:hypothetical protein
MQLEPIQRTAVERHNQRYCRFRLYQIHELLSDLAHEGGLNGRFDWSERLETAGLTMRSGAKTRLSSNMDHICRAYVKKLSLRTSGYRNCRAVETVENELHVFHRSHRAWKTRHTTPSFPQFPQPLRLDKLIKKAKDKNKPADGLSKNPMDKMLTKA